MITVFLKEKKNETNVYFHLGYYKCVFSSWVLSYNQFQQGLIYVFNNIFNLCF